MSFIIVSRLRAKLLQRDVRKFHIEGNNDLSDENN